MANMDKAVLGYMRIGYFRIGVFRPDWDKLQTQFENVNVPLKVIVDGAEAKVDSAMTVRVDVFTLNFEEMKKGFEKVT